MNAKELIDRVLSEDSYHEKEILQFIQNNERKMGEFKPSIKVFGQGYDTRHLAVTFDALRQIAKILRHDT